MIAIQAQTWQQLTNFPAVERDDGAFFIIGDKAFCGTGFAPWFAPLNDFYSFDMNTEIWNTIAALPSGMERQYACGFSSGSKGFIFGGKGNGLLNDLWMYDTTLNTWTQKTSLPGQGRSGSTCFVINDTAYIIGGIDSLNVAISQVWAYDILNDNWHQKNNLNFGARWRASSVSQNGKGYLIFGKDENGRYCNELVEYNPLSDSWIQISTFPGNGRTYSSLNSIASDLYTFAGLDSFGTYLSELWRYNYSSSSWQQLNSIPSKGRKGGMCFNNNSILYYTTGIDSSNTRLNETWKCTNLTSISEYFRNIWSVRIHPNPVINEFNVELTNIHNGRNIEYNISDSYGRIVMSNSTNENKIRIDISSFPKGLYFLKMYSNDEFYTIKVVKD